MENPLADNRLKKMAAQKTTKSVLDYIRQNCAKGALLQAQQQGEEVVRNGGKKGRQNIEEEEEVGVVDELADRMTVMAISQTNPEIIVTSAGRRSSPFCARCSFFCLYFAYLFLARFSQSEVASPKISIYSPE